MCILLAYNIVSVFYAVKAMSTQSNDSVRPIRWQDTELLLLDQRYLPQRQEWLRLSTAPAVAQAIKDLVIRGAPAIGITAAWGLVLSLMQHRNVVEAEQRSRIAEDIKVLAAARPTAVNLVWALERVSRSLQAGRDIDAVIKEAVLISERIQLDDVAANYRMGELGAEFIKPGSVVLTHCNAGSLATGGYGTALGVIRKAWSDGLIDKVYACETRPWLQGTRLTAWELQQDGIPVTLITDSAAAWLMTQKQVDWVITGADRVASNGDVANKIGTRNLAGLCQLHTTQMMVVAPLSTIDPHTSSGAEIEIEQRQGEELTKIGDWDINAGHMHVWNPVFDLTPADWVDVLVTEKGALTAPGSSSIVRLFEA